jgi:hypothetical protein
MMHAMHEKAWGTGFIAVERASFGLHAPDVAERALLAQQFLREEHFSWLHGQLTKDEHSGSYYPMHAA